MSRPHSTKGAKDTYHFFEVLKQLFEVLKQHTKLNNKEIFRIANALNPGTFAEDTKTFAIIIATDLNNVSNPIETVKEMVNFAYDFSEKFHANICDSERMPITKQMISHIETKAQEIMRLKQLADFD